MRERQPSKTYFCPSGKTKISLVFHLFFPLIPQSVSISSFLILVLPLLCGNLRCINGKGEGATKSISKLLASTAVGIALEDHFSRLTH